MLLEPGYYVSHAIKLNRLKGYLYRNSLETIAFRYVNQNVDVNTETTVMSQYHVYERSQLRSSVSIASERNPNHLPL